MAAPLPEQAASQAWQALAALRDRHRMVRWLPPEKLHLTLVFLGSTDSSRAAALASAIRSVAIGREPFEVRTGPAGGRITDRRGGVAWLRLDRGADRVTQLALALDAALGSATYGERRRPRPHLTVARGIDDNALDDLRSVAAGVELSWTVDRLVLFRSHTDPTGSRYEELEHWPLTPGASRS